MTIHQFRILLRKRLLLIIFILLTLAVIFITISSFISISLSNNEVIEIRSSTASKKVKPAKNYGIEGKFPYQQFYLYNKSSTKFHFAKAPESPIEIPEAKMPILENNHDIFSKVNLEITKLNFIYLAEGQKGALPLDSIHPKKHYYVKLAVTKSKSLAEQHWQALSKSDKGLASYPPTITKREVDHTILYELRIMLNSSEEANALCKKINSINEHTCLAYDR